MLFALLPAAFPEGYGEALVPLALARLQCGIDADEGEDDDPLIEALRDAAVDFVERYCSVFLGPRPELVIEASRFPARSWERLALPGPVR